MPDLELGKRFESKDAPRRDRDTFVFPFKARKLSHTHIVGGTRMGKSKLIQHMIQEDIEQGQGLCLLDWNGTLYQDLLTYLAYFKPKRRIVLINPSASEYIVGFNPFKSGKDTSVQVNRRIAATLKPWGGDLNEMPTFERTARLIFSFAIETGNTLPIAELLIRQENKKLRDWLIASLPNGSYLRSQWLQLQNLKSDRDWSTHVLSTQNRLGRFLGSSSVKRFMGLRTTNIDIGEEMEAGSIVLVNLGYSDYLDRESARVFGALFLNELFEAAMRTANNPSKPNPDMFFLYLDEFQEYITNDLAAMLDQVMKGGLSLVLAHQHMGQLGESDHLRRSVLTNARNRFVFGGIDMETALILADDMFLKGINEYDWDEEYKGLLNFITQTRNMVYGSGNVDGVSQSTFETADGSSGESLNQTHTVTNINTDIPWNEIKQKDVVVGRDVLTLDAKRNRYAEQLIFTAQKVCIGRVLDMSKPGMPGQPVPFKVFKVEDYDTGLDNIRSYEKELYLQAGGITAEEADQELDKIERDFLDKAGVKLTDKPDPEKPKQFIRKKKSDNS